MLTLVQSQHNLHGLVQRLVQKERQVLQLQSELERYKVQNPTEDKEAVGAFSFSQCLNTKRYDVYRRRKREGSVIEQSGIH